MSLVRNKDSKPEMLVRRLIHRMGFRYRLHQAGLPGRPDLVFAGRRKVVFVHGCFWHRHSNSACKLARLPKSNVEFWRGKLEANRIRDEAVLANLSKLGWKSMVVWECECRQREQLENRLRAFLEVEGE